MTYTENDEHKSEANDFKEVNMAFCEYFVNVMGTKDNIQKRWLFKKDDKEVLISLRPIHLSFEKAQSNDNAKFYLHRNALKHYSFIFQFLAYCGS